MIAEFVADGLLMFSRQRQHGRIEVYADDLPLAPTI